MYYSCVAGEMVDSGWGWPHDTEMKMKTAKAIEKAMEEGEAEKEKEEKREKTKMMKEVKK